MTEKSETVAGWTHSVRPPNLHRRIAFESYAETSAFLDRLAQLSEKSGYYPDISFGKTYANVTVQAHDEKTIDAQDIAFANSVNALSPPVETGG